ncbi:MAG TPA: hypothetical protein VGD60_01820 [Candidatus Acidoferrales bacterium]
MEHGAVLRESADAHVRAGLELAPENRSALTPVRTGKAQELASDEKSRVCGDEIEKACFFVGVTKGFERVDAGL